MVYFTSDLHLGHKGIISLCNRPFSSVDEMDDALIRGWNKRVKVADTVYIIGDLIWNKEKTVEYLSELSGHKVLITGNHDKDWLKLCDADACFEQISPYLETSLNCHPITFCHYPMLEWHNSRKKGSTKLGYMIHGHIHNKREGLYEVLCKQEHILNAGVDINNYVPVTFEELQENNAIFKVEMMKYIRG